MFSCDAVDISIDYFIYVSRSETHRDLVGADPSQVLLACRESVDESVGFRPYCLVEKMQSSIRPFLATSTVPFHEKSSVSFRVALALFACDSCAEEPVRVPVRVRVVHV